MSVRCPKCRKRTAPGSLLCDGCGSALVFTPAQPQETSQSAAESIEGRVSGLELRVYRYLKHQGASGATDQEIQDALDLRAQTEGPRRIGLAKKGLVVDSGKRRLTHSRRKAIVWVTT